MDTRPRYSSARPRSEWAGLVSFHTRPFIYRLRLPVFLNVKSSSTVDTATDRTETQWAASRSASEDGSGTPVGVVASKLSAAIMVKSKSPTEVANVAGATESVPVVDDKAVLRP